MKSAAAAARPQLIAIAAHGSRECGREQRDDHAVAVHAERADAADRGGDPQHAGEHRARLSWSRSRPRSRRPQPGRSPRTDLRPGHPSVRCVRGVEGDERRQCRRDRRSSPSRAPGGPPRGRNRTSRDERNHREDTAEEPRPRRRAGVADERPAEHRRAGRCSSAGIAKRRDRPGRRRVRRRREAMVVPGERRAADPPPARPGLDELLGRGGRRRPIRPGAVRPDPQHLLTEVAEDGQPCRA